jgi:activating signal cointegrator complex subunit 3
VRERIEDWKERLEKNLGRRVVELTGDVTPDARTIERADVIVTTPEKWDGISRSWQNRDYVRKVRSNRLTTKETTLPFCAIE